MFEKGDGKWFAGMAVVVLVVNVVFWLALITGVLALLRAFGVL